MTPLNRSVDVLETVRAPRNDRYVRLLALGKPPCGSTTASACAHGCAPEALRRPMVLKDPSALASN
jgi:hypothetical protein